jgi:hypothetical protein
MDIPKQALIYNNIPKQALIYNNIPKQALIYNNIPQQTLIYNNIPPPDYQQIYSYPNYYLLYIIIINLTMICIFLISIIIKHNYNL